MAVDVGGKKGFPDIEGRVYLQANLSYVGSGLTNMSVLEGDVRVRIDYVHRCSYILRAEPGTRQPRLAACLGSSAVQDRVQQSGN
jgi:hypothetical protein